MFIHGGELSLAQAGGGPGLVRQVQPECDHEMHQKKYPGQVDKERRGPGKPSLGIGRESQKIKTDQNRQRRWLAIFFLFYQVRRKNALHKIIHVL
jgi:hypothetical protein